MIRGRASRKTTPWEWVATGVGVAGLQLLTRGGFDPFLLFMFLLAAKFASIFKEWRYSTWASPLCGLLFVLGIQFWVIDLKVVTTDAMAPRIQKNARIFYQPTFLQAQEGDLLLLKYVDPASPSKLSVGQVTRVLDRNHYEVTRLRDHQPLWITRGHIRGKIFQVINPSTPSSRPEQHRR